MTKTKKKIVKKSKSHVHAPAKPGGTRHRREQKLAEAAEAKEHADKVIEAMR